MAEVRRQWRPCRHVHEGARPERAPSGSAGAGVGMRAARLHELGGTPAVEDLEPPEGPDVIAVTAAGLNPVDVSIGSGRFYGGSPETPYVIGSEGVGATADGRRVWFRGSGTIAEQAVAPPELTFA